MDFTISLLITFLSLNNQDKVKDYVTGKEISDSTISKEYKGIIFFFENQENLQKFEKAPEFYFRQMSQDYARYSGFILKHYLLIHSELLTDKHNRILDMGKIIKINADILSKLSPELTKSSSAEFKSATTTISEHADEISAIVTYTCPMHPDASSSKPGECPKCGMKLDKKADLKKAREIFSNLSNSVIKLYKILEQEKTSFKTLFVYYCSMAKKSWLQDTDKGPLNPYYGPSMLKCGNLVKEKSQDSNNSVSFANPDEGKCPVSGEEADPDITYTHKGKAYAFCCKKCVTKFKSDPEKYLGKGNDKGNHNHGSNHGGCSHH